MKDLIFEESVFERINVFLFFFQMVQAIQVLRFHLLELEKVNNNFKYFFFF